MSEVSWQEQLDGVDVPQQLSLDLGGDGDGTAASRNEAKASIRFMLEAALEYGKVANYTDLLDQVAALSQYKPYNALLILLQRPGATYVLPAHVWGERYRRAIRPHEQPLVLLQPNGPVMFLFDVSQTEATAKSAPLPIHLQNPFAMREAHGASHALHWVKENAKADGVRVSQAHHGLSLAGCIWPSSPGVEQTLQRTRGPSLHFWVRYETLINASHTDTEQLATLAHELGHLYCGHIGTEDKDLWPDRRRLNPELAELEAESVARLVFKRLFPGVDLPDYLSEYFQTVLAIPPADVERVLKAAGRVIETADGYAPRKPRRPRPRLQADGQLGGTHTRHLEGP